LENRHTHSDHSQNSFFPSSDSLESGDKQIQSLVQNLKKKHVRVTLLSYFLSKNEILIKIDMRDIFPRIKDSIIT